MSVDPDDKALSPAIRIDRTTIAAIVKPLRNFMTIVLSKRKRAVFNRPAQTVICGRYISGAGKKHPVVKYK